MTDPRYWVGFNLIPQIGPVKVRRLLDHFGDLATAWTAGAHELAEAGLDQRALQNLLSTRHKIDLDAELEKIARAGVQVLTWADPTYPAHLSAISNPPPVLYIKGEIHPEDEWAIAVVGTRRASPYGREVTRQLVTELVFRRVYVAVRTFQVAFARNVP